MTRTEAISRIRRVVRRLAGVASRDTARLVPSDLTKGKLYEAFVLAHVLEKLNRDEGFSVRLRNSARIELQSSPGAIRRERPHFELLRDGEVVHEVWTDIEFLTLSYDQRGRPAARTRGDFHELDIVTVPAGTTGNPAHSNIILGVECKHVGGYEKSLLREVLGVRRELSLLSGAQKTAFLNWPAAEIPANPPSCLLVFCSHESVREYQAPGEIFGIEFNYLPV